MDSGFGTRLRMKQFLNCLGFTVREEERIEGEYEIDGWLYIEKPRHKRYIHFLMSPAPKGKVGTRSHQS